MALIVSLGYVIRIAMRVKNIVRRLTRRVYEGAVVRLESARLVARARKPQIVAAQQPALEVHYSAVVIIGHHRTAESPLIAQNLGH